MDYVHVFQRYSGTSSRRGPIGNDIEVKIDSLDIIHGLHSDETNDTIEGEVRLLNSMTPMNQDGSTEKWLDY